MSAAPEVTPATDFDLTQQGRDFYLRPRQGGLQPSGQVLLKGLSFVLSRIRFPPETTRERLATSPVGTPGAASTLTDPQVQGSANIIPARTRGKGILSIYWSPSRRLGLSGGKVRA